MEKGDFKNVDDRLLKPYDPQNTEDRIYKKWEESGFFNPDICIEKGVTEENAEPFSIILPPPNVTGTLHIGHAAMLVIEDIMTRYARMNGKRTLWLPGTDHAAIATQSKVEKILEKEEGKRKTDLGREEFLKRVNTFAQESHDTIVNQVKKMGASVDWSREAFTLDKKREVAVYTAFKKMYDDGLIYRGHRIVNWDPKGQTVISDDEVVHEERKGKLYTFKYSKDFPISISTTRPETKVGDVAVAVNPSDERYMEYIGKEYDAIFCSVPIHIKIVADESVEKDFGTGALGVTPAHSQIDAEIALRHKLPTIQVINEFAKMMCIGELNGKKTSEARTLVVEWLKNEGLLEKEEDITQNISTAERTGAVIEPLPKLQWFIDVNKPISERGNKSLKELMLEPVKNSDIKIVPERFERVYYNWVENLRDWCISRQIWYGHRIPVWYKGDEIYCDTKAPNGDGWTQDEDTLDTWFSSGLWSFSTLGWPEETKDLKTYHPTTILETGYDIIFFWVARMILMSQYLIGEVPFKNVYLHGLVRDGQGRKMSKSLGNIIDPLDMIAKYGADAVRMSLIIGTGPGNDSKMSEDKIKAYKHFANKIWNITRFVMENTNDEPKESGSEIMSEFQNIKTDITDDMENYRFYLAGEKIYQYIWHRFADEIIEESKKSENIKNHLLPVWIECLKILHPFMPFVTEELWEIINNKEKNLLIVGKWN